MNEGEKSIVGITYGLLLAMEIGICIGKENKWKFNIRNFYKWIDNLGCII